MKLILNKLGLLLLPFAVVVMFPVHITVARELPASGAEREYTLDSCYVLAMENYPMIRQYGIIQKLGELSAKDALSAYIPQINLGGEAAYYSDVVAFPEKIEDLFSQFAGMDFEGLRNDQYKVALDINQAIWDGGYSGAKKAMAIADAEVSAMETATVHPLQAFADLITIEEHKTKARPKVVLSWAPHCRALPQAVPNSLAQWMNAADVDFVVTHPEGYELDPKFVGNARVEYDQMKALEGADFVYAKNWSCPGVTNPADYGKILSKDMSWTIDEAHMAVTDNGKFMHCLPVRRGLIVTDDVIEGPNSLVIPEAANREISASVVIKRMLEAL